MAPYKTSSGTSYTLYPWSFDAGVLPANFWSPQSIVADLATSQGRLFSCVLFSIIIELVGRADENNILTNGSK